MNLGLSADAGTAGPLEKPKYSEATMRPIRQRTDEAFSQALKCVGFRLPTDPELKPRAVQLALAERYGLIGVAAAHHLLTSSTEREEEQILVYLRGYGGVVEEHLRSELLDRLPFAPLPGLAQLIGMLAREPMIAYIPLYRRPCPLDLCLQTVSDEYFAAHREEIALGSNWFTRRSLYRQYKHVELQSLCYARGFFERRQAGLEEVKEIALLGE